MFRRLSLRGYILAAVVTAVLVVGGALLGFQYFFTLHSLHQTLQTRFSEIVHKVSQHIKDRNRVIETVLYEMGYDSGFIRPLDPFPKETVRRFLYTMRRYERTYAITYAAKNGDFLQVINAKKHPEIVRYYGGPEHTDWVVLRVFQTKGREKREVLSWLNEKGEVTGEKRLAETFDVTRRDWFQEALKTDSIYRSHAYLFSHLNRYGVTFAKKISSDAVIAVELTHDDLNRFFKRQLFTDNAAIVLYDEKKRIIASTAPIDFAEKLVASVERKEESRPARIQIGKETCLAERSRLSEAIEPDTFLAFCVEYDAFKAPYMREIYESLAGALILLLLSLPLLFVATDRIVAPLRRLVKENEKIQKRRYDEVRPVATPIAEVRELSDSLVALAESVKEHERSLRQMIEAFVRIIAEAIDQKSHYTGGHCERVPTIALSLAEVVNRCREGKLSETVFDKETLQAFEMAAWLHDCGKITTPEYVVDKATKLETIYNRIHEIRTRFEVLWRDEEIACYEAMAKGEKPREAQKRRDENQKALQEEFAFVARCNLGDKPLKEAEITRLQKIARRRWRPRFDNRLGLSEEELARMPQTDMTEAHLLMDAPWHKISRDERDKQAYAASGFKTPLPEWLYNRGELYNLSIRRGTLSPEERFKIEEHVMMTIRMLEKIPYPKGLEKIPLFAGTHHETPDGHGYPRKLKDSDIPIEGKILAIADIFEALTAADRPYKRAKTLSEALVIMAYMCKERKLDREIFILFVHSDIWLNYAKERLKKFQIDEVDTEKILEIVKS
ncbi:MAG: amino acid ABC transporter [Epsilonproteobacteria bacterium]|nr:amino acid ABC transporter [Campylobacterota bacterium]